MQNDVRPAHDRESSPHAHGASPADADAIAHFSHMDRPPIGEAYRLYGQMRTHCPVAHSDRHGGFYLLSTYAEARTAAKDWRCFSSAQGAFLPTTASRVPPLEFDPPEHSFWRGLLTERLGVSAVRRFEATIRTDVIRLIDGFAHRGACEFVHEFALILPSDTIVTVLGIADRAAEVRPLTDAFLDGATNRAGQSDAVRDFERLRELVNEEFHDRRAHPRDDLLTHLAQARRNGRPLELDDAMWLFLVGLIVAGNLTTVTTLTSLVFEIASRPELQASLRENERLIPAAIEEAVRLHAPSHVFRRVTTQPVTVRDVTIPAGAQVALMYASANRDAARFPEPESFRLDRASNPHLGFGAGIHRCVGAPLARLQIRVAVEEILRRLDDLTLGTPAAFAHHLAGAGTGEVSSLALRFARATDEMPFTPNADPSSRPEPTSSIP